jgi:hypothetical protein
MAPTATSRFKMLWRILGGISAFIARYVLALLVARMAADSLYPSTEQVRLCRAS